ncbi:kinase-like domain-containing protein [Flagelloscypha sp. PMI_526]|nr:kinase-like domain-containing protein [Flagelloscypha sp. PMI_526]
MGHNLVHSKPLPLDQIHDQSPAFIKEKLVEWRTKSRPFDPSSEFKEDFDTVFAAITKDPTLREADSLHAPLCRLCMDRREDPLFLKFLQASLPSNYRISFASSTSSSDENIEALAIITPTGQSIWDTSSRSSPSTFLFKGSDGELWDLLRRRGDAFILSRIGVSRTALALCAMDVFQWGADYAEGAKNTKKCVRILHKLSKMHHSVPPSLRLPQITVDLTARLGGGGFSDVYRGSLRGRDVSVKVLRLFMEEGARQRIIKDFCRETLVWRQLNHPNILSFCGFNDELFAPSFCLVSPLLSNGNVISYLVKNPKREKTPILVDVASGMHYLHSITPAVVHGDLRGANILVKDNLECCLDDFGLSIVTESYTQETTSRNTLAGSTQWMAPELFDTQFPLPNPDPRKRDIYAFACTILEVCILCPYIQQLMTSLKVYTQKRPFPNHPNDAAVCFDVAQGRRPIRPSQGDFHDDLWDIVQMCWDQNPTSRPESSFVLDSLTNLAPFPPSLANTGKKASSSTKKSIPPSKSKKRKEPSKSNTQKAPATPKSPRAPVLMKKAALI